MAKTGCQRCDRDSCVSKDNIWNVNCALLTGFVVTHERMFLRKCRIFKQNMPRGGFESKPFELMTLPGPDIFYPIFWNIVTGGKYIFLFVKSTFEISTVRGQHNLFFTHERIFLSRFLRHKQSNHWFLWYVRLRNALKSISITFAVCSDMKYIQAFMFAISFMSC